MRELTPAEVTRPGEYIKMELEARGWTQTDLAEILGRAVQTVSDLINGKCGVTPETATGLAAAFGTTAQVWMNLQTSYDLWHANKRANTEEVSRRARLYDLAPVSQMAKRGWIERSDDLEVLEQRVLGFYGNGGFEEKSKLAQMPSITVRAWLFRAKQLARMVHARMFTDASLDRILAELKPLRRSPEGLKLISGILAEGGVRFLIIEPLPSANVDGATLWLDSQSPIIALSVRHDRIDRFWQSLMHELWHVGRREGDQWQDLFGASGEERPGTGEPVDVFADDFLVPSDALDQFMARTRPFYSKQKIIRFAEEIGVHPGIVVGQLHRRKEISGSQSRDLVVKVRSIVTESALTDGWGHLLPAGL